MNQPPDRSLERKERSLEPEVSPDPADSGKPPSKRAKPECAETDLLGKHRSFAEILFRRVVETSVPATDAFKILQRRVRGLTFQRFEEEYRRFYLRHQGELDAKQRTVCVNVVDIIKPKRRQSQEAGPQLEAKKEAKRDHVVLPALRSIEAQCREIVEKKPVLTDTERLVIQSIQNLLIKL